MNRVSVVLLNHNGALWFERFLPLLDKHTPNEAAIVIVDNASCDKSLELAKAHIPRAAHICLSENYGYARGYNEGLRQLSSAYYVLLNTDVAVQEDWLWPLLNCMEAHPEAGACQPKIRDHRRPAYFEYAGAAGGMLDLLAYPFCRGRLFDAIEEDRGQYDDEAPIFWASGACLMLRAEAFWKVGGFDETFFMHMEEIDLCWRMHRAGYGVYACPSAVVYHVGSGTLGEKNPQKTYYKMRNNLAMLYKNTSGIALCWKLPLRLWLDALAGCWRGLCGHWGEAKAIWRGQAYFLRHVGALHKRRRALSRMFYKPAPLLRKVLIWSYFLKRQRTYQALMSNLSSLSNLCQRDAGEYKKKNSNSC